VSDVYGECVSRIVTFLTVFSKETELVVGDWPLDITEQNLREIFRLRPEQDRVGEFEVTEAERDALQPFTSHVIDLEAHTYQVGDRDVEYGR
jgi:hypothetical protein